MYLKSFSAIIIVLILSTLSIAQEPLKTGYDVYHGMKMIDEPSTPDDLLTASRVIGYLDGFLDGLALTQDMILENILPSNIVSSQEQKEFAKQLNYKKINIPPQGIHIGQLIMIYKNYAEKYPEKLSGSARVCILESLIEAYGWN